MKSAKHCFVALSYLMVGCLVGEPNLGAVLLQAIAPASQAGTYPDAPSPLAAQLAASDPRLTQATPKGTRVTVGQPAFAAYGAAALEDVLYFADQQDQLAVAAMVYSPFPTAFAYDAGTRLRFEGCYSKSCDKVRVRELDNAVRRVMRAEDLVVTQPNTPQSDSVKP